VATERNQQQAVLSIGLIINPIAGLGGSLALKGSDNLPQSISQLNGTATEGLTRSHLRACRALSPLLQYSDDIRFVCWGSVMGQGVLDSLGFEYDVAGCIETECPSANDTRLAASALADSEVDIIVFVGGDGTARDIFDVLGDTFPVLGVPAGVKMHSAVFAVSPEAAGELLVELVKGGLVGLAPQEVRDIDEQAFRENVVKSRFYGEMLVPAEGRFLQHTKVGGVEDSELAAADIAAWIVEIMEDDCTYIIGPGSTTGAIMAQLGLQNTLLGVDVIRSGQLELSDASEEQLLDFLGEAKNPAKIVVTAIGGQGHVFGRGNQQISAAVIKAVGLENIDIVAAKSKISALQGRPLLLDTNDTALDEALSGYRSVVTGYQDKILYRLATIA
jgi:predicted polyphosphate/ATP-dependent NAD kinase